MDITDRKSETHIKGPLCGARIDDLGYIMGSALWTAQTLLVDARPFMSVGLAGSKLGYCERSPMVVGIPMASISKNPYADASINYHMHNMDKMIDIIIEGIQTKKMNYKSYLIDGCHSNGLTDPTEDGLEIFSQGNIQVYDSIVKMNAVLSPNSVYFINLAPNEIDVIS